MIHYHGSPCSGVADQVGRFYAGRHAMVSFAYPDQLPIIADVAQSFVLDNGAFTAWKQGRPMDVEAYIDWCDEWHRHPGFQWALIPDVIDGTPRENDYLVGKWKGGLVTCGIRGVPVWHLHEPIQRLTSLMSWWPKVAIGSSGKWSQPGNEAWWERMEEVMPRICDEKGRPYRPLHGLRMLNPDIFTRLPFASADSTNAAQNAGASSRFGMYVPLQAWQRANVIADRIEAHNSAAAWVKPEEDQLDLFERKPLLVI